MLTLYHMPFAICAQKTRVCLAEKGVPWESRDVTAKLRSPEYIKLNPAGYVPTLVDDGRVVTESRIISEYIDEAFDGPSLQPTAPFERAVMRRWTKLIDESLHPLIFVLTFVALFRERVAQLSLEDRKTGLPLDPVKAERMLEMIDRGWESRYVPEALRRFDTLMGDMELALSTSNWLAGGAYSLADADYTPYLRRLEDLGLQQLWRDRPAVSHWYKRVQDRKSFKAAVDDWVDEKERRKTQTLSLGFATRFREIMDRPSNI